MKTEARKQKTKVEKRRQNNQTMRELSKNMQNHNKKGDSEHQSIGKSKEQMVALNA